MNSKTAAIILTLLAPTLRHCHNTSDYLALRTSLWRG